MLSDKTTIQQILGGLIKNPRLLNQSDKYQLTISDFTTRFEKILFVCISNLNRQGLNRIQINDIENFLETDEPSKRIFEQNNGIEYIQDIEDFVVEENFDYYYKKLKKINLLKEYDNMGIDISEFYCDDLTKPKAYEINQNFETLSITDIVDKVKKKILNIESKYLKNDSSEVENVAEGLDDLINSFYNLEDVGKSIQGIYTNEVMGGARKGTLCIRSGSSGLSKSRQAVGDACFLAFPLRYNSATESWEKTGNSEKVLFIATEQDFSEIRKMILAYLTDINESRFRYGLFNSREEKVLQQAKQILNEYKDNFFIVRMPSPTIELVKHIIRENCLTKQIEYVFYDYVFISPSLLGEFRGHNLRNDELLLLFTTALKDVAVEQNVFVMTSTQVNANSDDNRNIRNEASLAGGRSTINKADFGFIMARPTKEELETLEPLIQKFGLPNIVTDVFKVRSGRWTQVRIWSRVELGTLRKEELFMTDSRLEMIPIANDFEYVYPMISVEEEERLQNILNELEKE